MLRLSLLALLKFFFYSAQFSGNFLHLKNQNLEVTELVPPVGEEPYMCVYTSMCGLCFPMHKVYF